MSFFKKLLKTILAPITSLFGGEEKPPSDPGLSAAQQAAQDKEAKRIADEEAAIERERRARLAGLRGRRSLLAKNDTTGFTLGGA